MYYSTQIINVITTVSHCESRKLKNFLSDFSPPEPKAHGELIVYQSSRRPSVRPYGSVLTLSSMNISTISKSSTTKFYLKHHLGGGKVVFGLGLDRIGTLVSMTTDSSHRVMMGKILLAF